MSFLPKASQVYRDYSNWREIYNLVLKATIIQICVHLRSHMNSVVGITNFLPDRRSRVK